MSDKSLIWKILYSLFNAKVKYQNTKQQPLIPNGVIKNCKQIHSFFFVLDNKINIGSWLKDEIKLEKKLDAKHNQIKKRTGNAKIIAQTLRKMLNELSVESDININNNQNKCHYNDHQHVENEMISITSSPSISQSSSSPILSINNNNEKNKEIKKSHDQMMMFMHNNSINTGSINTGFTECSNHNLQNVPIIINNNQSDYNSVIFAMAEQFMATNNTNHSHSVKLPQNMQNVPTPTLNVQTPQLFTSSNNMINIMNIASIQNRVRFVPLSYNGVHMASYHQFNQYQVSSMYYNLYTHNIIYIYIIYQHIQINDIIPWKNTHK